MNLFAPDYYKDFKCVADKCQHSCCIGWEIDIDSETLEYYNQIPGETGLKLKENIATDDQTPHFILTKDERCPFLENSGLCELINKLGHESLCQICNDHPRFRNFFSNRTEIGLGLCCEAAGKLILSSKKKTKIINLDTTNNVTDTPEEQAFFNLRGNIINILQNRSLPVFTRIDNMLKIYNITLPSKTISEWAQIFLKLEHLDNSWVDRLNELHSKIQMFSQSEFEIPFEQLILYFIYRHLPDALEDGHFKSRIAFAALSFYIINALCQIHYTKYNTIKLDDLVEIARLYSSEIEYCEENINTILAILEQ